MTDTDSRAAARFIADVWAHEYKRIHRRPRPDECAIAAHALATQIIDSFVGNHAAFLGAPRDAAERIRRPGEWPGSAERTVSRSGRSHAEISGASRRSPARDS